MAERQNNDNQNLIMKFMRKQKRKQRDPHWCLSYFTDLQAETPRFKIPEQNV